MAGQRHPPRPGVHLEPCWFRWGTYAGRGPSVISYRRHNQVGFSEGRFDHNQFDHNQRVEHAAVDADPLGQACRRIERGGALSVLRRSTSSGRPTTGWPDVYE